MYLLAYLYVIRGQSCLYTQNDWSKPLVILRGLDGSANEGVWEPDQERGEGDHPLP